MKEIERRVRWVESFVRGRKTRVEGRVTAGGGCGGCEKVGGGSSSKTEGRRLSRMPSTKRSGDQSGALV